MPFFQRQILLAFFFFFPLSLSVSLPYFSFLVDTKLISCLNFIFLFLAFRLPWLPLSFTSCSDYLGSSTLWQLRVHYFATTRNWQILSAFYSELFVSERGNLFGYAYIVEPGHNPIHWSEFGSIFLDQVPTPHLVSWSQHLGKLYGV